ncbi:MAG: aspartate aminotransferase family protein [Deltaproteobacteria bacterium]|nr:MAG: aspartate aminotransferase family protein [Deltaproteobacteria bacterium]
MPDTSQLLEIDRRHVIHPLHHVSDHRAPLLIVEAKGPFLYTADGREIIDGLSGLWNVNIGHGRKELAAAAAKQMERLAFASAYVGATNEPAVRLAERLVDISYSNISAVYFTTAGAESNESAFKFARYYWKVKGKPEKTKFVSRIHGYHGVTIAAMSATGQGTADALEERIRAEGPDTVAAVIAEPVMGAGGVIVPPDTYWPALRRVCDKHDVLLIADEVITGFGRTGRMFALDRWNVEPDLVSFAKGVTSAYIPLGGVLVSKKVHEVLTSAPADQKFMHAATYSGHPVCCAVGLANLDIIEKDGLPERAATMGKHLLDGLRTLSDLPEVGDVRGLGMMCGVELVTDKSSKAPAMGLGAKVAKEALARGLLVRIRAGGRDPAIGDTICLAPPLMTPKDVLDRIVDTIKVAIIAARTA